MQEVNLEATRRSIPKPQIFFSTLDSNPQYQRLDPPLVEGWMNLYSRGVLLLKISSFT